MGWWYGSCKVIKSWRLVPHSSNWAVNPVIPKTNYRYRSTDTPTMPADPLNGSLGGESTKSRSCHSICSVRRNNINDPPHTTRMINKYKAEISAKYLINKLSTLFKKKDPH